MTTLRVDQIDVQAQQTEAASRSLPRQCQLWCFRLLCRSLLGIYLVLLGILKRLIPVRRAGEGGKPVHLLLTGTFYSDNWIHSLIRPIIATEQCGHITIVSTYPFTPLEKTSAVLPPPWLIRFVGRVPARLMVFGWLAIRLRPEIIGGFHLLVNGLVALFFARLVGARSLHFCNGGAKEVLGGGIAAENRLFSKLGYPDPVVERQLLKAVAGFDQIIATGTLTERFFRARGITTNCTVACGAIDDHNYSLGDGQFVTDVVFTGRLVEIKRLDVLLESVSILAQTHPTVKVTLVGDGPLREELRQQAVALGIANNVEFAGFCPDVRPWLTRARLFVLPSDSEGLSLSLLEAMMCGAPAVVSDVGDLGDLVISGVNGYLVPRRDAAEFARRMGELLSDERKRRAFSVAARESAMKFSISAVQAKWDVILRRLSGN